MTTDPRAIATACLTAAHDGSLSFPEIVARLIEAGFEGYSVDYRAHSQTYYPAGAAGITLMMPGEPSLVAADFDASAVAAQVAWAQSGAADYSYTAFSQQVAASGCAGYLVSFPGRRVVYYGRDAQTHVEHFPG